MNISMRPSTRIPRLLDVAPSPRMRRRLFHPRFILHENLKQDSAALAVFRDFGPREIPEERSHGVRELAHQGY